MQRDEISDEESEGSLKDFIENSDSDAASSTASSTNSSDDDVQSVHSDDIIKKNLKKARKANADSKSKVGTSGINTRRTRAQAGCCMYYCFFCTTCIA